MSSSHGRIAFVLGVITCAVFASCAYKKAAPTQALSHFFESGAGGDRDRVAEPPSAVWAKLEPGAAAGTLMAVNSRPDRFDSNQSTPQAERKIIRTGSLDLLVNNVGKSVDDISAVVSGMGGYVEKAERRETGMKTASMVLRVPADRLDEAMAKIKSMATRVDIDAVQAQDVTREFVDLDARLRNTRAEEARYLVIMKRAATVKDTLEVAEKLSDVRGRIEQLQGEMNYLKTQVALSRLDVSLHAESEATVMGLHWRPLRQAKAAGIEMLQGLADWVDSVIAFVINIPLILVWVVSVVVLAAVGWRIVRFVWRKPFPNASVLPSWLRGRKPEVPAHS